MVRDLNCPTELVPSGQGIFALIHSFPDRVEVAWMTRGLLRTARTTMASLRFPPERIDSACERLKRLYALNVETPRCETMIASRRVTVIPSPRFACDLHCTIVHLLCSSCDA